MIYEETRQRLIKSITYALLAYRAAHNKEPNCIMLNQCAYKLLMTDWEFMYVQQNMNVIYGMPIRVTREATDDINCPRFWLCEEGIIYNHEIDEE